MKSLRWIALAAMLAVLCPAAARAVTFQVSKTTDTNDGLCNTDCSLREAVNAFNGSAPHGRAPQ